MTWIGKILSVFVLIVGVAAMWFMATLYVARNNWKNDRDAYANLYKEAETARKQEQEAYLGQRASLEAQIVSLTSQKKSLDDQVASLKNASDAVAAANTKLTKTIGESDVKANDLQAQLQALTDEAKKLRDRGTALEKERQDLVIAKEVALKDRQAAENTAKQAIADKLVADGKIESLNTQISELKATGGNASATVLNSFGKPPAPLPDGIRGHVTEYKDGYVALSIGIDAGLTKGAVLDIYRTDGDGKYLGTVMVERVYPKEAVAKFTPADVRRSLAKLRADELPKANDTVGKIGISGPLGLNR